MCQSIHSYFQVGTLSWMSYPPDRFDVASSIQKLACDDFFDAIEICHMDDEAVAFAMKAHEGAFRKGTKVPYIVHPLRRQ